MNLSRRENSTPNKEIRKEEFVNGKNNVQIVEVM